MGFGLEHQLMLLSFRAIDIVIRCPGTSAIDIQGPENYRWKSGKVRTKEVDYLRREVEGIN